MHIHYLKCDCDPQFQLIYLIRMVAVQVEIVVISSKIANPLGLNSTLI